LMFTRVQKASNPPLRGAELEEHGGVDRVRSPDSDIQALNAKAFSVALI
jgi:hypothetical protein